MIRSYKCLYGPVYSWRLSRSLGVDPLSAQEKICNMDCVYCQLGKTVRLQNERRVYFSTREMLSEIESIPRYYIDYITFSGRGEPTLAENLGEMIGQVKSVRRERVAVITNSSLLHLSAVREDLKEADYVLAKLDAGSQSSFDVVNRGGLDLRKIIEGIAAFRKSYRGKLALQIMVVEQNLDTLEEIAQIVRRLKPDEVHLNTPLRPGGAVPVERHSLQWAKRYFAGMKVTSVYEVVSKKFIPMDEAATKSRHGNFRKTRLSI